MTTKTIMVPKDMLLYGYAPSLTKMMEQQNRARTRVNSLIPWTKEDEAYLDEMNNHFDLIRKSKEDRFELKVNIEQGGTENV